jgi:hypothetical protein
VESTHQLSGWPEDISTEDALAKLLELNLQRSG